MVGVRQVNTEGLECKAGQAGLAGTEVRDHV